DDRDSEIAEGIRLARRGAEYGRDDAVALARSGHALLHLAGEIDAGIALLDRALVLNPNLAFAWALGGYARMWDGDIDGALARFTSVGLSRKPADGAPGDIYERPAQGGPAGVSHL